MGGHRNHYAGEKKQLVYFFKKVGELKYKWISWASLCVPDPARTHAQPWAPPSPPPVPSSWMPVWDHLFACMTTNLPLQLILLLTLSPHRFRLSGPCLSFISFHD